MELYKYMPYNTIKSIIVPPPPSLARPYYMDIRTRYIPNEYSVIKLNKKRLMTELRNVFLHLSEVKYNKFIKKSYFNIIDLIFKHKYRQNSIGCNQSMFIKNIISKFILNVNDTLYTI
jgi:hypothetical protein